MMTTWPVLGKVPAIYVTPQELWCKKAPPGPAFVEQYRHTMQPHPNWNAPKPP